MGAELHLVGFFSVGAGGGGADLGVFFPAGVLGGEGDCGLYGVGEGCIDRLAYGCGSWVLEEGRGGRG